MSENGLFGNGLAFGLALRANDMRIDHDNKMNQAQVIIDREFAEKMAVLEEIKKLKLALSLQIARAEGLRAKSKALSAALETCAPGHRLLSPTGRVFASGDKQSFCGQIFENVFDEKAKSLGIPDPEKYRSRAK